MLGIAVFVSSAAISMGQEKTAKIRLGAGVEIGRKDLLFSSIASVCEDDQANFIVVERIGRNNRIKIIIPIGQFFIN